METIVINALRTAAECYENDARIADGQPRIAEQFTRQAQAARNLADHIESGIVRVVNAQAVRS
jgi:hypothetical protein